MQHAPTDDTYSVQDNEIYTWDSIKYQRLTGRHTTLPDWGATDDSQLCTVDYKDTSQNLHTQTQLDKNQPCKRSLKSSGYWVQLASSNVWLRCTTASFNKEPSPFVCVCIRTVGGYNHVLTKPFKRSCERYSRDCIYARFACVCVTSICISLA